MADHTKHQQQGTDYAKEHHAEKGRGDMTNQQDEAMTSATGQKNQDEAHK